MQVSLSSDVKMRRSGDSPASSDSCGRHTCQQHSGSAQPTRRSPRSLNRYHCLQCSQSVSAKNAGCSQGARHALDGYLVATEARIVSSPKSHSYSDIRGPRCSQKLVFILSHIILYNVVMLYNFVILKKGNISVGVPSKLIKLFCSKFLSVAYTTLERKLLDRFQPNLKQTYQLG